MRIPDRDDVTDIAGRNTKAKLAFLQLQYEDLIALAASVMRKLRRGGLYAMLIKGTYLASFTFAAEDCFKVLEVRTLWLKLSRRRGYI